MFHSVPGVPRVKIERMVERLPAWIHKLELASAQLETGLGEVTVYLCRTRLNLKVIILSQLNFTTSKSEAFTPLNFCSSSLFHLSSGTPLKYMLLPISARINPYFFIAVRITCK